MSTSAVTPKPIAPEQSDLFEAVTSGIFTNFALVSTLFDGEPTVCIASVNAPDDEAGDYVITPLYVAVTPAMFERLTDPAADLT